jgi:hypothetical protein
MIPPEILIDLAWLRGLRAYGEGNHKNPFVFEATVDSLWREMLGSHLYDAEDAWRRGYNAARVYHESTGNLLG